MALRRTSTRQGAQKLSVLAHPFDRKVSNTLSSQKTTGGKHHTTKTKGVSSGRGGNSNTHLTHSGVIRTASHQDYKAHYWGGGSTHNTQLRFGTAKGASKKVAIGVGAAAVGIGGYKAVKHFQARKHGERDYNNRPKVQRTQRMKAAR